MIFQGFLSENLERRPGQKLAYLLAFISIGLYIQMAYFTPRTETILLLSIYTILFISYLLIGRSVLNYKIILGFGILYRLIFIFSMPALSDDFYRFFWDGILIMNRINPFMYLPNEIINNPAIIIPELSTELFNNLNSPDYYTVYPPMSQFVFWIAAWMSGGNLTHAVVIMKLIIFSAEIGSIYLIWNLLKFYKLKKELTLHYILNPLVIIELTGNIHFEAIMIFGVLLGVYAILNQKLIGGALAFALAIISKLTPILLLPFMLRRLKLKRSVLFYAITLATVVLTFLPFFGQELFHGLGSSIGLYFQKFEFNASIFYIVRALGFWIVGYDIIRTAGLVFGILTFIIILWMAFYENLNKQNIPGIFLWPLFVYFAFTSIIHPWYVTPLIAFSLFTRYKFPIVWSYTVFLSYAGYSPYGFQEQTLVLWLEYLLVFGVMIYEVWKYKDLISLKNSWKEIYS